METEKENNFKLCNNNLKELKKEIQLESKNRRDSQSIT